MLCAAEAQQHWWLHSTTPGRSSSTIVHSCKQPVQHNDVCSKEQQHIRVCSFIFYIKLTLLERCYNLQKKCSKLCLPGYKLSYCRGLQLMIVQFIILLWPGFNHVKILDWNVNKSARRLYNNAPKVA
jgi:hypothetical protein